MKSTHVASSALFCAIASVSSHAAILYGIDAQADYLFSIETSTAHVTIVGAVGDCDIAGLGTGSDGTLYWTSWGSGVGRSSLLRVNPQTAATQFIGTNTSNFQSFEVVDDVGYGIYRGLYRVDLATGVDTLIGDLLPGRSFVNFGGLAYADGLLYAYGRFLHESFGRFVTVDPETGALVETIQTTPTFNDLPDGLAYAEGSLWGVDDHKLWRFELATRVWSIVATELPVQYASGLTAAVPVPGAALCLCGMTLPHVRRRRTL